MKFSSRQLLLGLGLLASCGASGSSGSSSDNGGSDPNLSFSFSSSTLPEDTVNFNVVVQLDDVHDEDIEANFYWSGTALEFVDYAVTSGTPVTIQSGQLSAAITVQVFEDDKGELDETIRLTLVPPQGANLGSPSNHVITVRDDDEIQVSEQEPNDDHLNPQEIGSIATEVSYEVLGLAVLGNMDVYKFDAMGSSTVFVSMDPQSGVSEAVINVLDENGNVVATIDDDVGGTTVSTSFAVVDLQVFFLALTVEVAGTNYVLDVVGV
jgi:hypothetical protein